MRDSGGLGHGEAVNFCCWAVSDRTWVVLAQICNFDWMPKLTDTACSTLYLESKDMVKHFTECNL